MKEIVGFPNYIVDEYGNVFNVKKQKYLKPYSNRQGYLTVELFNNGIGKQYFIHQLVARTFIGIIPNTVVNHIDGNRRNNYKNNLELITQKQNNEHGHKRRNGELLSKEKVVKIYKQKNWSNVEEFLIALIGS